MGGQLFGGDILIYRTEIDGRIMLQYLDLNLASILRGQQANVVGEELEQILRDSDTMKKKTITITS